MPRKNAKFRAAVRAITFTRRFADQIRFTYIWAADLYEAVGVLEAIYPHARMYGPEAMATMRQDLFLKLHKVADILVDILPALIAPSFSAIKKKQRRLGITDDLVVREDVGPLINYAYPHNHIERWYNDYPEQ